MALETVRCELLVKFADLNLLPSKHFLEEIYFQHRTLSLQLRRHLGAIPVWLLLRTLLSSQILECIFQLQHFRTLVLEVLDKDIHVDLVKTCINVCGFFLFFDFFFLLDARNAGQSMFRVTLTLSKRLFLLLCGCTGFFYLLGALFAEVLLVVGLGLENRLNLIICMSLLVKTGIWLCTWVARIRIRFLAVNLLRIRTLLVLIYRSRL